MKAVGPVARWLFRLGRVAVPVLVPVLVLTQNPVLANGREVFLVPQRIPHEIGLAVDINHEVGRDVWGLGGVSAIRHYAIQNGVPDQALAAISALVRITPALREYCRSQLLEAALARYFDPELVSDCATTILNSAKQGVLESAFAEVVAEQGPEYSELDWEDFSKSLRMIESFVVRSCGRDLIEFSVSTARGSIEQYTSLIFSRDYRSVLLVYFDLNT